MVGTATKAHLFEGQVGKPERKQLRSLDNRGQRGRNAERSDSGDGVFLDEQALLVLIAGAVNADD